MENKTKISIFLALLIIISTFTVVGSGIKKNSVRFDRYPAGEIELTKTVWNETSQAWEDEIYDVKLGETVRFNLSLTYYKNATNPEEWFLHDINITDILPDCLVFSGNVEDVALKCLFIRFTLQGLDDLPNRCGFLIAHFYGFFLNFSKIFCPVMSVHNSFL